MRCSGRSPALRCSSLFPVGVEARLEPGRLRVRVWPDAISTSTHDPRLTEQELAATKQYWRAEAARYGRGRIAGRVACAGDGHRRHSGRLGRDGCSRRRIATRLHPASSRCSRSSRCRTTPRRSCRGPACCPIAGSPSASAPDGKPSSSIWARRSRMISPSVSTRRRAETQALANQRGQPIQLPPRMRWLTDFAAAVQVGMAFDIAIAADVVRLDELFVVGVRLTADAGAERRRAGRPVHRSSLQPRLRLRAAEHADEQQRRRRLRPAVAHRARRGRLRPRAATARIPTGPGLERHDGRARVRHRAPMCSQRCRLQAPRRGVAAGAGWLRARDGRGDAVRAVADERRRVRSRTSSSSARRPRERVANYFSEHVRAAGPVPAMRVGRQPYGVLPVTTLNDFVAARERGHRPEAACHCSMPRARGSRCFGRAAVFDGSSEEALRHLGRSTQLFAETTPAERELQPAPTGGRRWPARCSARHGIRLTTRGAPARSNDGRRHAASNRARRSWTTARRDELAALAAALPRRC